MLFFVALAVIGGILFNGWGLGPPPSPKEISACRAEVDRLSTLIGNAETTLAGFMTRAEAAEKHNVKLTAEAEASEAEMRRLGETFR